MSVNQATIDLIKKWEGFVPETYRDAVGVLTIGYGTTGRAGVGIDPKPGMRITEPEGDRLLRKSVDKFARTIRPHITVPINENEFGAFVSLAYNIGPGAFIESTALRRFNDGDKGGAVEALKWFNRAGGKRMQGLANRREDEARLFLTPAGTQGASTEPAEHWLTALIRALLSIFGARK